MVIKKGKVTQARPLDEIATQHSVATVIEKTEGNYVEVLVCRESHELIAGGSVVSVELMDNFKVYVDKTIEQALALNDITEYIWTEPLTQVS